MKLSDLYTKAVLFLKAVGRWFYEVHHQAAFGHVKNLLMAQKAVFGQALLPVALISAPLPLTALRLLPYAEEELICGVINLENRDFLSGLDSLFDGV